MNEPIPESARPNGVSSLEEFRHAAQMERDKRAEHVKLPSGLVARLVRMTPMEHMLFTGQLPQRLAAELRPGSEYVERTVEYLTELSRRAIEQVRFVFVSPRVPDELRPGIDISFADVDWALRWSRGEVAGAGQDLAEFRQPGDAGATAEAGPDSGDVPVPPLRTAAGLGRGFSD
jgi:hypothetical protein